MESPYPQPAKSYPHTGLAGRTFATSTSRGDPLSTIREDHHGRNRRISLE